MSYTPNSVKEQILGKQSKMAANQETIARLKHQNSLMDIQIQQRHLIVQFWEEWENNPEASMEQFISLANLIMKATGFGQIDEAEANDRINHKGLTFHKFYTYFLEKLEEQIINPQ